MEQLRPQPSEEVTAVFRRFFRSLSTGDGDALKNLVSREQCFIAIGTDPNEWWVGPEETLRIWSAQQVESGGWSLGEIEVHGWEMGPVGWAACRAQLFD